jgi:hypothetical protein
MPSEESIVPRKGESFPFINGTPGSATESSHSRLLIRSHVGSWVWQKTKQTSEAPGTDKVDDSQTCQEPEKITANEARREEAAA